MPPEPLSLAPAEPTPTSDNPYPGRRNRFIELPLQPIINMAAPWIVSSVLQEHDNGQFQRSALLWEQMRRDDRVSATVSVRINALLGLEHDFSPEPPPYGAKPQPLSDEETAARTDAMKSVWMRFCSPAERRQILSWGLGLGFAFGRQEMVRTATEWCPRLTVWHPAFVTWRQDELGYYVNTANQSQVRITPGEDGWWLWTPFGFKRGWAEGFVHKLAMAWLARTFAYRDWCRYNEIHGLPMVKAFLPINTQDDDSLRFMGELANRSQAPVVRLPRGKDGAAAYDFELVEAKADTWEAFQGMKNDANTDIAVAVLGQNLTTEVQGGSYAAAKVQDKVRGDILDDDARSFEAWFDEQVGKPYAAVNFPIENDGSSNAFLLRFQTQETDDLLKAGTGLAGLGDGVTKAVAAGIKLNVDEMTRRVDIPTTGPWEKPEAPDPADLNALVPGEKLAPGKLDRNARAPTALLASEAESPAEREARLGHPSARVTQEQGQAYADAIVDAFARNGALALNEDRLRVLSVIMSAESLEEMLALLEKTYADMDPTALADIMSSATALAELNGWYSARGA